MIEVLERVKTKVQLFSDKKGSGSRPDGEQRLGGTSTAVFEAEFLFSLTLLVFLQFSFCFRFFIYHQKDFFSCENDEVYTVMGLYKECSIFEIFFWHLITSLQIVD